MELNYKVEFITEGFEPSQIKPKHVWEEIKEEFMIMYNEYCRLTNEKIGKLNDDYHRKHPDKVEFGDDYEYALYMREAFEDDAFRVNQKYKDYIISGYVGMDGPIPVYKARLKQYPDKKFSFVLKPME